MNIRTFLLGINMMIITLAIFIDLTFAEEEDSIDVIIIEKPKWCNSASISYYFTPIELEKEYKYPCVMYMTNNL